MHTPGHTRDSMCLVAQDRVFTGDTLLIGGTGRTDLPTGDSGALYDSLFNAGCAWTRPSRSTRRTSTRAGRRGGSQSVSDERHDPIRVLFVCTGNSARSVMAEALLRQHGGDAFEVHSAGTEPKGINPLTLRVLADAGIDASWARSKSVDEYLGQSFDYVVTVCDEARQSCPVFPGVHDSLHWGYEDPAEAEGTEEERLAVFRRVFIQIGERVRQFATVTAQRQPA